MALAHSPRIVTDGLVLCLDAGNAKSYPGSGTSWSDLSGNGNNGTLQNGVGYNGSNLGLLSLDGVNDYITTYNDANVFSNNNSLTVSIFVNIDEPTKTGRGGLVSSQRYQTEGDPGGYGLCIFEGTALCVNLVKEIGGVRTSYEGLVSFTYVRQQFKYYSFTYNDSTKTVTTYMDGVQQATATNANYGWTTNTTNRATHIGRNHQGGWGNYYNMKIGAVHIHNRALTAEEIKQNYNSLKGRYEKGGINNPFSSPTEARVLGYTSGDYYFQSGSMSSPQLLEFQRDYYENRGWVCAFRSPYRSTATTNKINLNIPMGGLLVQRDTLDLRAAVYWSTPITYNTVGGSGNNTADSGYSPRRVILGGSGGHGIYATNQNQCSWSNATGAIGAGWNGSTCGSFPNDLVWGTGQSNTATYANQSGTWSHWITW
jgi:hypothetical protein